MTWEYRVIRDRHFGEEYFLIKEVYYGKDENDIIAIGDAPIPNGNSLEDVKEVLELMERATNKPVLDSPLFKNTHVYCVNCIHFKDLMKSIENENSLSSSLECNECNPFDFEDSKRYEDRPNYKLL